jgi:hypothetical protein
MGTRHWIPYKLRRSFAGGEKDNLKIAVVDDEKDLYDIYSKSSSAIRLSNIFNF